MAKLAGVSRARVAQILGLLSLAPEIQKELLFAGKTTHANCVAERAVRQVVALAGGKRQLRLWSSVLGAAS